MLNYEKVNAEYDFFGLYKYKLRCFLNTRNKSKSWAWCSYHKWGAGVYNLNLTHGETKIDLIRWFDGISDIDKRKREILVSGYTLNDFECVKLLLSRFGYVFRIDENLSDKDYRLFFFILQLVNVKNSKVSTLDKNKYMNLLLKELLCELFMSYEEFSRFSVGDDGIMFDSENLGVVYLHDFINLFFLSERTENSECLGRFYLSLVGFLFVGDNEKYSLDFDDKYERLIYFDYLNDAAINVAKERRLFKAVSSVFDKSQSTHELFISNMLLMAYIFYFLKDTPEHLLKLKEQIKNDALFFRLLEAVIKRRLIVDCQHFYNLGLDADLLRVRLNETRFYNILYER